MKKPVEPQACLRDDIPHPGIGLFVGDREKASADKAYSCAVSSSEGSLTEDDDVRLRKQLLEAARHYWADFDYDARTSASEIKAEIDALQRALGKVVKVIDKLSVDARAAIRTQMHRATQGAGSDLVEDLLDQIKSAQAVCLPIASVTAKKGPRAQDRVLRCCERLWVVREDLTRRPFSKSLDKEFDARGIETGRFARPDAQFVLAVMRAMDENVTFSQVHDGLKNHPASRVRGK